jgi:imidazolonepropionase-like amidohydrolase
MGDYLIENGTLIDATGAASKPRTSVYVSGNRIAKIGSAEEVKAWANAQGPHDVIDASGMTVMPGIIDAHCHISYGDILSFEELDLYASVEFRSIRAAFNARKVLRAGVTAICDPGSTWNISVGVRDAIDCGMIEGPRITAGGRYITTFNAIGSPWPTWMEHPPSSFAVLCNTRDEMVTEVRREVKEGVDVIKVAGDGDTLTNERTPAGSLSPEDLKAIADTTHRLGKRCTIHARSGRVAADAARAGFDWVIHSSFMTEDDLAAILEHRTPICPTLSLLANTLDWGPDLGVPDKILDGYKRELDAASRNLTKAFRSGVMMMAGTDTGQGPVPYGEWHARELEHLMTFLGMSSMEALLAGTKNAAFSLGKNPEVGTVEVGKLADLLVVDGDPLADIAVLQDRSRLKVIMKDGSIVDTTTPIPERRVYGWEKPMLYWNDHRMPTQEFVREHARRKPAWMQKAASKNVKAKAGGRAAAE